MKRSPTSSLRRPPSGPLSLHRLGVVALALSLAMASACVSRGAHQEVVTERDRLAGDLKLAQTRVAQLEASSESLDQERVALANEVEDLRIARESLESSVAKLSTRSTRLAEDLELTTSQLALSTAEVSDLRGTYDGLVDDLQSEVAAGRIEIEQLREGLNVKLSQAILFPSGSARLSGEGRAVLRKVAGRLVGVAYLVDVNGHTDGIAIRGSLAQRYPSNWELAGARAASVVRLLEEAGVPSDRLAAISHAATRPTASNETVDGRAKNRRIEIRLRPREEGDGPAPDGAGADPSDDE